MKERMAYSNAFYWKMFNRLFGFEVKILIHKCRDAYIEIYSTIRSKFRPPPWTEPAEWHPKCPKIQLEACDVIHRVQSRAADRAPRRRSVSLILGDNVDLETMSRIPILLREFGVQCRAIHSIFHQNASDPCMLENPETSIVEGVPFIVV